MKTQLKLMLMMIALSLLVFTGCEKPDHHPGAKKFTGIGYFDATDACQSAGQNATFALTMTGDLDGCMYTFVDEFTCTDGNYVEKGREHFVGTYKGKNGSFWTTYDFQAKYEGCTPEGSYAGAEISGQCQHYLVPGSGTGVFEGVTGRYDMTDNVKADPINYPYVGYFKF